MKSGSYIYILTVGMNVAGILSCGKNITKSRGYRYGIMEQRVVTRYNLQVPAHVETTLSDGKVRSYEWKTRDVSSSGAFLLTNGQFLENGTDIKVNIFLNSFSGSGAWVTMNGRVVRAENNGIGVCFDGQYQFINNAIDLEM